MHTSKKAKVPKPIKVKKEKTEEDRSLQPMSHYIDDRLELVKQIFGTLKPKTITNLAPDFLKKKGMDEIEELCLNELLCISTKRLLSIINATKCPSDTESSGDSDVQHEEDHISLEEISSDSEIEGSSATAKKKTGGTRTKAKKDTKKLAEKHENDGPISVLELLELQARARAIRSQLALEPVTKIEVDSEEEKDSNKTGKSPKDHKVHKENKNNRKERKRKSVDKESSSDKLGKSSTSTTAIATVKHTNTNGTIEAVAASSTTSDNEAEKRTSKKVKLKRNYRINNAEQAKTTSGVVERRVSVEKTTVQQMKQERQSRSQSPDVITIVPEQETLLISDSSDMEAGETANPHTKKVAVAVNKKIGAITADSETETAKSTLNEKSETETEEGEISDSEVDKEAHTKTEAKVKEITFQEDQAPLKHIEGQEKSADMPVEITESKQTETHPEPDISEDSCSTAKSTPAVVAASPTAYTAEVITSTTQNPAHGGTIIENQFQEEDDQIDDVISIEGGDLESEMIEHLEEDSISKTAFGKTKASDTLKEPDADVISLESSDDERNQGSSESWHSRYLKSSKVSKVLATSRLGKRVRDKIKKSKRSKKDSEKEADAAVAAKTSKDTFVSKHEDGSMEQYKELLELRQRKT